MAEIAKYGGTVLQPSLSHVDEAKLQAALTHGKAATMPSASSGQTPPPLASKL